MNLEKLYKMQEELDDYILINHLKRTGKGISEEELLDKTILALLVEVGELANTTRCFKHWSTKGMMEKEVVLDELADVIHFYLSIGNQIGDKYLDIGVGESWVHDINQALTFRFLILYAHIGRFGDEIQVTSIDPSELYQTIGDSLCKLINLLGFTNKEVEQAYLKKHEENYRRQEEGY